MEDYGEVSLVHWLEFTGWWGADAGEYENSSTKSAQGQSGQDHHGGHP